MQFQSMESLPQGRGFPPHILPYIYAKTTRHKSNSHQSTIVKVERQQTLPTESPPPHYTANLTNGSLFD